MRLQKRTCHDSQLGGKILFFLFPGLDVTESSFTGIFSRILSCWFYEMLLLLSSYRAVVCQLLAIASMVKNIVKKIKKTDWFFVDFLLCRT